jgi:hypothetical protein
MCLFLYALLCACDLVFNQFVRLALFTHLCVVRLQPHILDLRQCVLTSLCKLLTLSGAKKTVVFCRFCHIKWCLRLK